MRKVIMAALVAMLLSLAIPATAGDVLLGGSVRFVVAGDVLPGGD